MTNKSLKILLVFLMIGCSNTTTVKIGYAQDEGNIVDINSANVESTNVIKKIVKIINLIFFLFLIYNSFLISIYLVIKLIVVNIQIHNYQLMLFLYF